MANTQPRWIIRSGDDAAFTLRLSFTPDSQGRRNFTVHVEGKGFDLMNVMEILDTYSSKDNTADFPSDKRMDFSIPYSQHGASFIKREAIEDHMNAALVEIFGKENVRKTNIAIETDSSPQEATVIQSNLELVKEMGAQFRRDMMLQNENLGARVSREFGIDRHKVDIALAQGYKEEIERELKAKKQPGLA